MYLESFLSDPLWDLLAVARSHSSVGLSSFLRQLFKGLRFVENFGSSTLGSFQHVGCKQHDGDFVQLQKAQCFLAKFCCIIIII